MPPALLLRRQLSHQDRLLRNIPGVAAAISLAYILTLEDPLRFRKSREVSACLGLVPRRDQSGGQDPQLHVTKAGDSYLRRLLVQSAQYILGPFGPDCDLRRRGLKLGERGGKSAKKRAIVTVARKLAVLLHQLSSLDPVSNSGYASFWVPAAGSARPETAAGIGSTRPTRTPKCTEPRPGSPRVWMEAWRKGYTRGKQKGRHLDP